MKVKVEQKQLLAALRKVAPLAKPRKKPVLPILQGLLIEAKDIEDDCFYISSTNLDIRIQIKCTGKIEEPGRVVVNADKLLKISRKMQGEMFLESNNIKIQPEFKICCNDFSFSLSGYDHEDFPPNTGIAYNRRFTCKAAEFIKLLNLTTFAVSLNDTRKALHGAYIKVENDLLTTVTTDGKRLAVAKTSNVADLEHGDLDFIFHLDTAKHFLKLCSSKSEDVLSFHVGFLFMEIRNKEFSLIAKVVDGNYPNYKQVIPESCEHSIDLPVCRMIDILETALFFKRDADFLDFTIEQNKLRIKKTSYEGSFETSLDVNYPGNKVFEFSFSAAYILDFFKKHKKLAAISMMFNCEGAPVQFLANDNSYYVIMPARTRRD